MKKIVAIILLVCLSLQIWGYHLYYSVQRMYVRSEVKEMLRRETGEYNTTRFAFTIANKEDQQLEWEGAREFRYRGELYDVIGKKTVNGVLHIRCVSDNTETALVNNYKGLLNEDFNNALHKKMNSLKKFFSGIFENITITDLPVYPEAASLSCSVYTPAFLSVDKEVPTPPPLASC